MSASSKTVERKYHFNHDGKVTKITDDGKTLNGGGSISGSISLNNTHNYTPTKRVAYDNSSSTFDAAIGGEFYGVEGQARITGYGSIQKINSKYRNRTVKAFGYENTQYKNNTEGVLDFNREKEQTFSKNTNTLPVTNYTYDTYNIEGQGVSGMFRPFRSKVGYLYNDEVTDYSSSKSFGAEFGVGGLVHGGTNFAVSPSVSTTGRWSKRNNALRYFKESNKDRNAPLYEQSAFKIIGELNIDNESEKTKKETPLVLNISGGKFSRSLEPNYNVKTNPSNSSAVNLSLSEPNLLKREGRLVRNQTVQKVTQAEADDNFVFKKTSTNAKPHHTVGMKVLQADGTTYVYGKSVYNTSKVEATFDVSARAGNNNDGLVGYNGTTQNKPIL